MRFGRHILAGLALLAAVSSVAQTPRSGGGESQKIMQQYQQLAAEKTALQAQVAQMKKDLESAQGELAATKKERDALKSHSAASAAAATQLAQVTASKETAEKNLDLYKQRMAELVARFRETATNLKGVEAERTQLRTDLDARNRAYDKCVEDNVQLYEINGEILDRYEHIGPFTRASSAEPFTRITRTRIENLVDEYRERALQLKVKKPGP
jgi:chromosome segregation ATPase